MYNLQVTPETFGLLWAALGELPAKTVRLVMNDLEAQVTQQEQAVQAEGKAAQEALATARTPKPPTAEVVADAPATP